MGEYKGGRLPGTTIPLLTGATGIVTGSPKNIAAGPKVLRGKVTGTGTVTATIDIYGSTEDSTTGGILLGTITLSGTTTDADGFAMNAPWPYLWADLTAISGTGASVDVGVGI